MLFYFVGILAPPVVRFPHGDGDSNVDKYKLSTLSLAHGVLRKNFSDDFTDGLLLKQLMLIRWARPSQP